MSTKQYARIPNKSQTERLQELYYREKNYLGRDALWGVYNSRHPEDHISQRSVLYWLARQPVHQLHQRPLKQGIIRPITASVPGSLQIDCKSMTPYKGFTTIFNAIDIFTKEYHAQAYKAQTAQNSIDFIKGLLDAGVKISMITSDNGAENQEPFQSWLKQQGIAHTFTKARMPWSNGVIERAGGTCGKMLAMAMYAGNTKDWVNLLPIIVKNINNRRSFSSGERPSVLAATNDPELHAKAAQKIQVRANRTYNVKSRGDDISVGDWVRKQFDYNPSGILKRSKLGYFARQIYIVTRIVPSKFANALPSYKIKLRDTGVELRGLYARWQLLPIPKDSVPDNVGAPSGQRPTTSRPAKPDAEEGYEVEKIVGKRTDRRGKVFYECSYVGYPPSANNYEPEDVMRDEYPNLVQEYESQAQ